MTTITVLDHSAVAPPPAAAEHRLPLTYLDMFWLYFDPIETLLFYPHPCSTSKFLESIVPNLKNSLSKTLAHYLHLSGNLNIPQNSDHPELRYCPGDSIPVTFAESPIGGSNFNFLTGNQARDADQFHSLVPDLPDSRSESGFDKFPLLAIQVTLFPEAGISVGFSSHHVSGDASSMVGFVKAWCSVAKLGENGNEFSFEKPLYDRSLVKDPSGWADTIFNQMQAFKPGPAEKKIPTNRVRVTFVLLKNEIQMLKNLASAKNPGLAHLSSFTVTAAYVWACLAKSTKPAGESVDENEPEYLWLNVDARHRLDPPLPAAYFGNCIAFVVAESPHGPLRGEDGFCTAANVIGEIIASKVNTKDELLRDADEWLVKYKPRSWKRFLSVTGSPRFDLYEADFGWGRPSKCEFVSIGDRSMSLCKSREFEGGLEIGLSLVKEKMDAFAAIFQDGLKKIASEEKFL